MCLRTLIRTGFTLLAVASITCAVSVVEHDLDTSEAGHIEIKSEVHNATGIRYVKNSGICETTPHVTQISGYIDVGTNMSMWFWFFESRNSPEKAPFTLWLNGGPGCSSMIGLFRENGPCSVNADRNSITLNPYRYPIGAGFSYGTGLVNSTEEAAPFVWTAFQVLFESQLFSKYASREFIFTTESYGGHYAPSFVAYFQEKNVLIASGAIHAVPIAVGALMINNGWIDPLIQNIAYLTFTTYAPGYGKLQPDGVLKNISDALYGHDGCIAQEKACYAAGNSTSSNAICENADRYCIDHIYAPAMVNYDSYDLRQNTSALFPPSYYVDYLHKKDVMKKIGAYSEYEECSDPPYYRFASTGDDARTWLPQLSTLANSGMKILIWVRASTSTSLTGWRC
ncbi:Alpha/Beta hydrolase protein [Suillus paluster]|uniref:Alpha/Beta hydrolase protein n=1 Tax=Suillus paluster TaxID=48578 RepID=UPI001B87727A|nr:Alpha/Beta hydrolase protein [Suillus paluster]KAG1740434.1 Alpha/Beta hydrolase protein [Suillus paluster]